MLIATADGRKPRYISPDIVRDFAGNKYIGACYYDDENNYDGEIWLFKLDTAGHISHIGTQAMTRAKGDGMGICQSGANIDAVMGGHVGDPNADLEMFTFENVAVPYPQGMQPGTGGAVGFEPGSDPGGDPVDYTRIEQIVEAKVNAGVANLVAQYGSGSIRQSEEDKDKDALKEILTDTDARGQAFRAAFEQMLQDILNRLWAQGSPDPDAQRFQARFDQDVRDRAYEADVSYGRGHAQASADALDTAMKQRLDAVDGKAE